MDSVFLLDAYRGVHLLGLALGLGFAIKADHIAFGFLYRSLKPTELNTLDICHRTIWLGLALFWISGLLILWVQTGFELDEFSKKLLCKLGVVSLLTANAIMIGRFAMPILRSWHSARLGELPLATRLFLGILGGISASSWASALTLGVFSGMKIIDPTRMYEVIGAVYVAGMGGSFVIACAAPLVVAYQAGGAGQIIATNAPEHQLQNLRPAS